MCALWGLEVTVRGVRHCRAYFCPDGHERRGAAAHCKYQRLEAFAACGPEMMRFWVMSKWENTLHHLPVTQSGKHSLNENRKQRITKVGCLCWFTGRHGGKPVGGCRCCL